MACLIISVLQLNLGHSYFVGKKLTDVEYSILQLNFPNHDLINRKMIKCTWVDTTNLKNQMELVIYPEKTGTSGDLIYEATKSVRECVGYVERVRYVSARIILFSAHNDMYLSGKILLAFMAFAQTGS